MVSQLTLLMRVVLPTRVKLESKPLFDVRNLVKLHAKPEPEPCAPVTEPDSERMPRRIRRVYTSAPHPDAEFLDHWASVGLAYAPEEDIDWSDTAELPGLTWSEYLTLHPYECELSFPSS